MRLLLIADTHVPKRAKDLPAQVWDEVDQADVVVHAGDWVDPALLDALSSRAAHLIGCWGNNDGAELRRRLPERADVTTGRSAIHRRARDRCGHRAGGPDGQGLPGTDVLVFGHSHIPWDTTARTGLRLLNPGSPTDRRRQPHCTYMTARIASGVLSDVSLHTLGGYAGFLLAHISLMCLVAQSPSGSRDSSSS